MSLRIGYSVLLMAALWLTACDTASNSGGNAVTKVVSTTSFGMCVGYCSTRLEIVRGEAVLVRDGRSGRGGGTRPDQRFSTPLSDAEWQEIATLAAETKIGSLPDVIGCPDCADGGAETLTIESAGRSKTIKFDHGAKIEEAATLLERVRALRVKLTPAE